MEKAASMPNLQKYSTSTKARTAEAGLRPSAGKWSFSKSTRFRMRISPTAGVGFIEPRTGFGQRATSFGFGPRSQPRANDNPAPGAYELRSSVVLSQGITLKKKFENPAFLQVVYASSKNIPGPGAYKVEKDFLFRAKGFQLKSRTTLLDPNEGKPGPGDYSPDDRVTVRKRYAGVTFGAGRRLEFTTKELRAVPGPGAYETEFPLSKRTMTSR